MSNTNNSAPNWGAFWQVLADMPQEAMNAALDGFVAEHILASLNKRANQNPNDIDPNTLHGVVQNLMQGMNRDVLQTTRDCWSPLNAWFNEYRIAEAMQIAGKKYSEQSTHPDESQLANSALNHQFLIENRTGGFEYINKKTIVDLFNDQSPNARYPHIIWTASHAHARNQGDLRENTHGIAAMARDSTKMKTPLNEARASEEITPAKTLIIMACEAQNNFLLEGAALFRRIRELEEVKRTGKPDEYKEISPAARRTAKLILACMVLDPDKIDIDNDKQLKSTEPFHDGANRITLKPNAIRIAQSCLLQGFSKAGNVESDVARYLADELMAVDRNNQPIIDARPAMQGHNKVATKGAVSIDQQQGYVRNIMRKIGLVSKAALEVEMSEHHKQCGVRRLGLVSPLDQVAYQNPFHKPYAASIDDEVLEINGNRINYGHHPVSAMGSMQGGARGYIHDHPEASRRLTEWYAPLFGKAALANVRRCKKSKCIMLETVPNTSDSLFESYVSVMIEAMKRAGLTDASIERNGEAGRFRLKAAGLPNDFGSLDKLADALKNLRKNVEGLVIAEMSYGEDIAAIKNASKDAGKSGEAPWVKIVDETRCNKNWPWPEQSDGKTHFSRR